MTNPTNKAAQVHTSLRVASELARSGDLSNAELARQVKDRCPEISAAQCRRAVDQIVSVRESRVPAARRRPANPVSTRLREIFTTPIGIRLDRFKAGRIADRFKRSGFRDAACDDSLSVYFGAVASCVRSSVEGWKNYKSQGYRKGITEQSTELTVPRDWMARIARSGLDSTSGMFTLDARRVEGQYGDGIEIYAAAWVRQGRGTSLEREAGHLAYHRPSGTTYHSTKSDPKAALSGLKRQLKQQSIPAEQLAAARSARTTQRQARRVEQIGALIERVQRHDVDGIEHVVVSMEDSHRAGNCEPGTLAFAYRFFPDRETEETTIGEIARRVRLGEMAALGEKDLELARQLAAACLVAIRRDKRARRLVTV